MLKAIETTYHGYRFRSRLEARWAVFFDALRIRYEYEPEGFELGDGVRYLPDFWLPEHELWVEIKPEPPTGPEMHKARLLARGTSKPICIFCSTDFRPQTDDGDGMVGIQLLPEDEGPIAAIWAECTECMLCDQSTLGVAYSPIFTQHLAQHGEPENAFCDETSRIVAAYTAARRARFEFGR